MAERWHCLRKNWRDMPTSNVIKCEVVCSDGQIRYLQRLNTTTWILWGTLGQGPGNQVINAGVKALYTPIDWDKWQPYTATRWREVPSE